MNSTTIFNRVSYRLLYRSQAETIKEAVEEAVREGVSLLGAYLRGADLRGADLYQTDLRYANLVWTDVAYADMEGANLHLADTGNCNLCAARTETIPAPGRLSEAYRLLALWSICLRRQIVEPGQSAFLTFSQDEDAGLVRVTEYFPEPGLVTERRPASAIPYEWVEDGEIHVETLSKGRAAEVLLDAIQQGFVVNHTSPSF